GSTGGGSRDTRGEMRRDCFPRSTPATLIEKSPATPAYNCIAWTLGQSNVWYDTAPGYYWPPRVRRPATVVTNVIERYRRLGFVECESLDLEPGMEKVVLYSTDGQFQHAALQLENGKWTSKLGCYEDVEHDLADALLGGELEKIAAVLMRPRKSSPPIS